MSAGTLAVWHNALFIVAWINYERVLHYMGENRDSCWEGGNPSSGTQGRIHASCLGYPVDPQITNSTSTPFSVFQTFHAWPCLSVVVR